MPTTYNSSFLHSVFIYLFSHSKNSDSQQYQCLLICSFLKYMWHNSYFYTLKEDRSKRIPVTMSTLYNYISFPKYCSSLKTKQKYLEKWMITRKVQSNSEIFCCARKYTVIQNELSCTNDTRTSLTNLTWTKHGKVIFKINSENYWLKHNEYF